MDIINPPGARTTLLGCGWARVALCASSLPQSTATDDPDWVWQPLLFRDAEQARFYLNGLSHAADMAERLRQLLAFESCLPVPRLTDAQVLDTAAHLLAEHRWVLRQPVLTAEARGKMAQRQASSSSAPIESQAVSPSRMRSPPTAGPAPQAATTAPENDFARIDQDTQAATLVAAAEAGVPFCELCEAA